MPESSGRGALTEAVFYIMLSLYKPLHGYGIMQNIKVLSPVQPNIPGQPPVYHSGFFFKLHGNAIFSNNDSIEVIYKPKLLP